MARAGVYLIFALVLVLAGTCWVTDGFTASAWHRFSEWVHNGGRP